MATDFGKKLKELREEKRYTQGQIATSLGVTVRQVQRYEEGTIPRPDKIKALNRLLHYDFFGLLDDFKGQQGGGVHGGQKSEVGADPLSIIANLTESNRMLAEANLLLANKISSGAPVSTSSSSKEKEIVSRNPVEDMQPGTQGKSFSKKIGRKKGSVAG